MISMIRWVLRGVDFHDPNLTRSPRIWRQYLFWCIHFGMSYGWQPIYPEVFRRWILRHYPHARDRWSITWSTIDIWKQINPEWRTPITRKPLPWWIGTAAIGPFVRPWRRVERFFGNHTGGRSHRCEFTDKQSGALYGQNNGAYMNALFGQFIENISDD